MLPYTTYSHSPLLRDCTMITVLVLLLLLQARLCASFSIDSQTQSVQVVNGRTRVVHRATVRCNENDVGAPQVLSLQDGTMTRKVTFRCNAPRYVYDHNLVGYIPEVQIPAEGKVCLVDATSFNDTIVNTQDLYSGDGGLSGGASRRLLSVNMKRTTAASRQLKWLDGEQGKDDRASGYGQTIGLVAGAKLGPAGAIVGGIVGSELGCWIGGCSGDGLQDLLDELQVQLNANADTIASILDWRNTQEEWNLAVNEQFARQVEINDYLQTQVSTNTESIGLLNQNVAALQAVTAQIVQTMGTAFPQFQAQIDANADYSAAIWNATIELNADVRGHITSLYEALTNTNRRLRNSDLINYRAYKDVQLRRKLTRLYWEIHDVATPQPTTPFVSYTGIRPMNETTLAAQHTLANAVRISSVIIQRTITTGTKAQFYNLSYMCDPVFLLDNTVPNMEFQTLFDFLGPPDCVPRTGGNVPLVDDVWTCNCVVVVEKKECSTSTAYPWNWAQGPMFNDTGPCDVGGLLTSDEDTLETGRAVVLETLSDVYSELNGLCTSSQTDTLGTNDPVPYKIRMFSEMYPKFTNLTLDETTVGTDLCNADFTYGMSSVNSPTASEMVDRSQFFGFNVYMYWIVNYRLMAKIDLPSLEGRIFGRIPSGLSFTAQPFESDPQIEQTYRCQSFAFTKTSSSKIPMFDTQWNAIVKSLEVEVDGNIIQTETNIPVGSDKNLVPVSKEVANDTSANSTITVTTDVLVNTDAAVTLPASFFRVGEWGAGDYTWDIPFDYLSRSGSASGRVGAINYIYEGANWTLTSAESQVTRERWEAIYGTSFRAQFVGMDPTLFKRTLTIPPGISTAYVCDEGVDLDGTTVISSSGDYDWCRVLNNYEVTATGEQMTFVPRNFEYSASIEVPGGTFVQTITSVCPTEAEVQLVNGQVYVTLNTTALEMVTISATINSNPPQASCSLLSSQLTFNYKTPAVVGPITAVEACQPLYFQAYAIDAPAIGCFSGFGLPLRASYVNAGGPGIPGPIQSAVEYTKDQVAEDMVNQILTTSDFLMEINNLVYDLNIPVSDIQDRVEALNRERERAIENMTVYGPRQAEQQVKALERVRNNTLIVTDNVIKNREAAQQVAQLQLNQTDNLRVMNALLEVLANKSLRTDILFDIQLESLDRLNVLFDDYRDANSADGCSLPTFIGEAICSIPGIGFGFGWIIQIITYVIIVVIFIACLVPCAKVLFAVASTAGSGVGAAAGSSKTTFRSNPNTQGNQERDSLMDGKGSRSQSVSLRFDM